MKSAAYLVRLMRTLSPCCPHPTWAHGRLWACRRCQCDLLEGKFGGGVEARKRFKALEAEA